MMLVDVVPDDHENDAILYDLLWDSCEAAFQDLNADRDYWRNLENQSLYEISEIERLWRCPRRNPEPLPDDAKQLATIPQAGMVAPSHIDGTQILEATT